jgi:hypothetical protein
MRLNLKTRQTVAMLGVLALIGCEEQESGPASDGGFDGRDGVVIDRGGEEPAVDIRLAESGIDQTTGDIQKPPARWEVVPGAMVNRVEHQATRLGDGRVLITGGWNRPAGSPKTYLADAYLFTPGTGQLEPAGTMGTPRSGHTATLLGDGRVLVVGGVTTGGADTETTDLYEPQAGGVGIWTDGPPMPGARGGHADVMLESGDVLIVGGFRGSTYIPGLLLFETATDSWNPLGAALDQGRAGATATLLGTGSVLVAGGYAGNLVWLNSLEVYTPQSGQVTQLEATLSTERSVHTATRLDSGEVLLVGGTCGSSCDITMNELYDPVTDTVSEVAHWGSPPTGHTSTLLADGRVLVVGGIGTENESKAVAYDPTDGGSWVALPELTHARHDHTATLLEDGSVLVVGGKAGDWEPFIEPVERFYP